MYRVIIHSEDLITAFAYGLIIFSDFIIVAFQKVHDVAVFVSFLFDMGNKCGRWATKNT